MIDGREYPAERLALAARGIDLNRDFVLRYGGSEYVGGEAMFVLASLGTRRTALRKMNAFLFRSRRFSRVAYPVLRFGRYALLRFLGRPTMRDDLGPAS